MGATTRKPSRVPLPPNATGSLARTLPLPHHQLKRGQQHHAANFLSRAVYPYSATPNVEVFLFTIFNVRI
jgi:hypothetical protein